MKRILCIAAAALLAGCAPQSIRHDPDADLRVYSTHRIQEPIEKIIAAYEADNAVKVSVRAGCVRPVIVPEITKYRDGDVLVVGSRRELDLAEEAGVAGESATIAWNPFVMVVKEGNPLGLKTPGDINKPGVRLVLPEAAGGCASRLSDQIVKNWGLAEQADKARRVDMKCHSAAGLDLIARGEADVTFTWRIVASGVDGIEAIPISKEKGAPGECLAVLLKGARNQAMARDFIKYLQSDKAQRIFRDAGLLDMHNKGP